MPTINRLILQPISTLESKMRQLNSGAIDFDYISLNSSLELIIKCSKCTCSNSNTTIDWGDGSNATEFVNSDDLCHSTTETHLYTAKGVFSVCVMVANDLSNQSFCRQLRVLSPVPPTEKIAVKTYKDCTGLETTVIPVNSNLCFQVSFIESIIESQFPSNFTIKDEFKYRINQNLAQSVYIDAFTNVQLWTFNEMYDSAGLIDARISLFNPVSTSLIYITIGVYEIISQCDTNITWKFPKEPQSSNFLKHGSPTNQANVLGFDKDVEICFLISKNTSPGSDDVNTITCQGQFLTSNFYEIEAKSEDLLCFNIPQNDTYNCHVNVSNPVSQCSDFHVIKVDKPVKGFKPVSYNVFPPGVPGRVGFSTFDNGQDMCALIYCTANCSTNFVILYFQEGLIPFSCQSYSYFQTAMTICGSNCFYAEQMFSSPTPDLYEVPPQNEGSILIEYVVWNSISLIIEEKSVAVTTENCNYPNLKINNGGEFYYEPVAIFKKAEISFEGEISVVCRETDLNEIKWCMLRYDEISGEIVDMKNPSEKLYGHLDDICTPINVESSSKPTLKLSEDILRNVSYGHYRFVLKVTMLKPADSTRKFDFSSYDSAYVNLLPSDLIGRMFEDVNEISVSRAQIVTLNPGLYSYDPDDTNLEPYNFKWWCRHVDEEFKVDLNGDWRDDFPPYLESYEFAGAAGGCDGNGPGKSSS